MHHYVVTKNKTKNKTHFKMSDLSLDTLTKCVISNKLLIN